MKILVTGGAGFIGSNVAGLFLREGHRVLVVDDLSSGHRDNLPGGVDFEQMDIRDPGFVTLVQRYRPEAVAHLAAQMDVRKSVSDPVLDADINVCGIVRLAQACREAGTRRILFSSTGGAIYGEQDTFPASEDHACRPVSPYGTSKRCGEIYLDMFERTGGPACLFLRYANVYGPRQDPHGEAGVVAIFAGRMLQGEAPVVFGDGTQTRDYVYVDDVARANLLALECEHTGVAINIGTGIETDVNTLATSMARICGFAGDTVYRPARAGEQSRSVIDPSRARQLLGWTPATDLNAGLEATVAYFRNRREQRSQ